MSNWAIHPKDDMSDEQIGFLQKILADSDKNYVLVGCAGSGKTLIAAYALSMLSEEGKKTSGFVTFTKLLTKFVQDGFKGTPLALDGIDNYHSWGSGFSKQRDILLVDEFQDFEASWIEKIKLYSKNQIWLGDPSQRLYDKPEVSEGLQRMTDEIKTAELVELSTNYRNSINVGRFASNFIELNSFDKMNGLTREEKVKRFLLPIANNPTQNAGAVNQPTVFIQASSEGEEYDAIAKLVKGLLESNEQRVHIAIAQLQHKNLDDMQIALTKRGLNLLRIPKEKDFNELPDFNSPRLVVLTPIHSVKGLEFDYVIFPRTETEKIEFWQDPEVSNNLLFVLFTRARKRIYCSYVDKAKSYVVQKIQHDMGSNAYMFVSASEIIGNGEPKKSEQDIENQIDQFFQKLNDTSISI